MGAMMGTMHDVSDRSLDGQDDIEHDTDTHLEAADAEDRLELDTSFDADQALEEDDDAPGESEHTRASTRSRLTTTSDVTAPDPEDVGRDLETQDGPDLRTGLEEEMTVDAPFDRQPFDDPFEEMQDRS